MHRLALHLGRTVAELRATMSAAELDDWSAYYAEEPFGAVRDNVHAGIIASIIGNASPNRKKGTRPFRFDDFMLMGPQQRDERRQRAQRAFITALRTIGKKVH